MSKAEDDAIDDYMLSREAQAISAAANAMLPANYYAKKPEHASALAIALIDVAQAWTRKHAVEILEALEEHQRMLLDETRQAIVIARLQTGEKR